MVPLRQETGGLQRLGASAQVSGPITKQGRRDLWPVLVDAARSAFDRHPDRHAESARLVLSPGTGKATAAMVHNLLHVAFRHVVGHVLTDRVALRDADRSMVARKLQRWGAFRSAASQEGLRSGAFARPIFDRLSP